MQKLINTDLSALVDELYENQFSQAYLATGSFSFCKSMPIERFKEGWILPLVKIVKEYINTGNPFYKRIYNGERIFRPFSPLVSSVFKKNYFDSVLKRDVDIFVRYFGESERLYEMHNFNNRLLFPDEVTLTTLGDCLMSQINSITAVLAWEKAIGVTRWEYYIGAFGEGADFDDVIQPHTNANTPINIVAVSPFTYWGVPGFRLLMKKLWESDITDSEAAKLVDLITEFITQYIDSIEKKTRATVFLHNASGLPWLVPDAYLDFYPWNLEGVADHSRMEKYLGKINNKIDKYVQNKRSVFLVDERRIASEIGRTQLNAEILAQDILKESIFHYNIFGFFVAEQYMSLIEAIRAARSVKILFVDFDNTLWSGNMAEGDVIHHLDRQKIIYELYLAGVLLVALSKNDEKNIRWSEISIDYDCFCLLKINWNSKVANIVRAIKELNISIDQAMVLDDSPQEIGLIRSHLPKLRVIDSTLHSSWQFLEFLIKYASSRSSLEINRTHLYSNNIQRKNYLEKEIINFSATDNLKKLYGALNITLTANYAAQSDIDRIYELLLRTNQFNCSGKIFTPPQLEKMIGSECYKLFTFHLKDNFGDMGLVSAVVIKIDHDGYCIENFVLSCRAMGYSVEKSIMNYLVNDFFTGCNIEAILVNTGKNFPAHSIYQCFGFTKTDDHNRWLRKPSVTMSIDVEWIKLEIGKSLVVVC